MAQGGPLHDTARIERLLSGILFILSVLAMFFAKDVLLPIVLGILISLTLSPIVRWSGRHGIPVPVTSVVLVLSLAVGVALVAYMISGPVNTMLRDLPNVQQELSWKLRRITESVQAVQDASKEVQKIARESAGSGEEVQKVAIAQPGLLNYAVSSLANAAASLAIALVLAIFLLSSNDLFYAKFVKSFDRFEDKKKALQAVYDIERKVSRYLLTITAINAGLGCAVALSLYVIGVPSFYIWGLIAFLLNFLPYVGAIAGVIMVGIYTLVTVDPISAALFASAAYLLCTVVEGQFVTPMIVGRRLELNTVAVFVTVVFWGWLWGIAGALMAVPFLVLIKVIADNVPRLRTFGDFLSSRDRIEDTRPIA